MDKIIIERWDKYKGDLEHYFRTTRMEEYSDYKTIVAKIIELVLNGDKYAYPLFNADFTVIDNGDYQGTQIFIIHEETYQPDECEYWVTHNDYGSCSGCDTLLGIIQDDDDLPNEDQIKGLMTLSLHIIQRLKRLVEYETEDARI